jgi:shikimate kinase
VTAKIQESIKAAEQAVAGAKSAREAGRPGGINLTVTGDFDDQVVISVDGKELARSTGKAIALQPVPPGQRVISAHAKKGTKDLDASVVMDVRPGLQELKIAFS